MNNVYVPDVNFKKYLLSNKEINLNSDKEILFTKAPKFITL